MLPVTQLFCESNENVKVCNINAQKTDNTNVNNVIKSNVTHDNVSEISGKGDT